MRPRLAVLASALTVLGTVLLPPVATAAPRQDHQMSIAATPNPVIAGEGVLIYGHLDGPGNADQPIRLYHHLRGSDRGYTLVGTTTTDAAGNYEFTRQEGVVYTNRNWFVRGPDGSHSRTIHERVTPLVSLAASTDSTDTGHPIVFTGAVDPNHAFERVFLQQQIGSSDGWRTLATAQLGPGSRYLIAHRWRRPGVHDVRVVIRRSVRNIAGASDPVSVNIEQAQLPGFTIDSSQPIAPAASSVTISGVLDQPGTSTPDPGVVVQLWGRGAGSRHFTVLADGTTGSDGSYQFNQPNLLANAVYQVRTMRVRHTRVRHTAVLFQGVQDVLRMQAGSTTVSTGQRIAFTGTVMPDKADHVIYLQRQGKDGDWHTVEVGIVRHDSTFVLPWQFGDPGTYTFRARITSDRLNVGSHSTPVTVTVTS